MTKSKLYTKPTYFKSATAYSDTGVEVDHLAGKFGAGIIRNVSVITYGEALGHGMWIDSTFVNQVAQQLSEADAGVKVRFTHPNQSGDGLAKGMGRAFFRSVDLEKGKVFADIHLWKSAHDTPDGNLAKFVMERAMEDPASFGTSISFRQDQEATKLHEEENSALGSFNSDDYRNEKNLPHIRLAQLRAVDFVDEPAANPDGLFAVDETFQEAEALLSYLVGISDVKPEGCTFGVDPDRVSGFLTRFMETHKMEIKFQDDLEAADLDAVEDQTVAEAEMSEDVDVEVIAEEVQDLSEEDTEVEDSVEAEADSCDEETPDEVVEQDETCVEAELSESGDVREDLKKYVEAFGAEFGTKCFLDGIGFEEAQNQFIKGLKGENQKLVAALELQSETEGAVLSAGGEDVQPPKPVGFATNFIGQFK